MNKPKRKGRYRFWWIFPTFIIPALVFGQAEPGYIPDGTQGEYLEELNSDTIPSTWKDKRWRLFPGKFSTLKLGGGFLYEYAGFKSDAAGKRQMDSAATPLEPTFKVRDFRIVASGQFKTKRVISWKAGLLYDGPSRSWFVRETGFTIGVPELSGHFFIGRTKEGFSLNKVMNGYAGWTMERQMALDVIPILADGIKWVGYLPKQRLIWNIGGFVDWISKEESFSTYHWQFISRVGWLPVHAEQAGKTIHLGVSYRYGEPVDDKMILRSRPEANPAPYFIDTETFASSHSTHLGWETYYKDGPLMVGSEYYFHIYRTPETGDPVFKGGELVISYFFTGESRPYKTETSIFGFVPVKRSVFKGGPGAIEGILRLSHLDLSDGDINGGSLWRLTPMVNWYLNEYIRFEIAYGYAVMDRYQLNGHYHLFQSRVQLTLL